MGRWVALLDDQHTARAHAYAAFPAVGRALQLAAGTHCWQADLAGACFGPARMARHAEAGRLAG